MYGFAYTRVAASAVMPVMVRHANALSSDNALVF
jgi:hypothetical protein